MNQNELEQGVSRRRLVERREQLLGELRPVVVRRGRRRAVLMAACGVGSVAMALAAVVGLVNVMQGGRSVAPPIMQAPARDATEASVATVERPAEAAPMATVAAGPTTKFEMVGTRVGISKAVEVVGRRSIARASDDDLISAFYETGQEPELVRVDGRVVVAGNLGRP